MLYAHGIRRSKFAPRFIAGMVDSLNAEVSLGTVANIKEAIQWIGYTYLFVRMRRNPMVYGKSISNGVASQLNVRHFDRRHDTRGTGR
jgi:replicative superfamily II helicase